MSDPQEVPEAPDASRVGQQAGAQAGEQTTDSTGEPSQAQQVADAVLAVDGVTALHGGAFGEVATYLPGRSVSGVKVADDVVSVHVVVAFGHDLREVAAGVRRAAAAVVTTEVEVVVEDVVPAS